jgi:glycosyltransferase involved in cell wall biosynthesis
MKHSVSIVVPIKDERENIRPLVGRLETALASVDHEILLVDDGSVDGGYDIMLEAAAHSQRIRLLRLGANRGKSAALAAGFERAGSGIICTIDADLQNAPEDIPRMLEALDGCDLVTGIRTNRQDSLNKRIASSVANQIRRKVLKDDIVDIGCGLKVFRRDCLSQVMHFNGMHRFLPAMAQCQGLRVRQIPVSHGPRQTGKSKYGLHNRLWRGMADLLILWWLTRRKIDYTIVEER